MSTVVAGHERASGERRTASDEQRIGLGAGLRQAWVGYRVRLDARLAEAGFEDHRFPDGRVLRICSRAEEPRTISDIGRELRITRQGASKLVSSLRERGYVILEPSSRDRREKVVSLTRRGQELLAAQYNAARAIETELRGQLGTDAFESLRALIDALRDTDQPRLAQYLRNFRD